MLSLSFLFFIRCDKDSNDVIEPQFTIQITNSDNGEVVLNPQKANYKKGETVTITAIADDNYSFTSWIGNIPDDVKNNSEISVVVKENIVLEPDFTLKTPSSYTLNIDFDSNKGTVNVSPNQQEYQPGAIVNLSAVPAAGYEFVRWEGDVGNTSPNIELTMSQSYNITCVFEKTDNPNPTKEVLFEFEGEYEFSSKNWIFNVKVQAKDTDTPIEDYVIKVDDQTVVYNNVFEKYHLEMSREDNDAAFQISIDHSSFAEKIYSITPANFPEENSLLVEQSPSKESFTMTWVDVGADGYRITKELFGGGTSARFVIVDFYNGLSETFDKADIWTSGVQINQYFDRFLVWVNPVMKVTGINDTFSDASYIEIVGRQTAQVEGKR